MKKSMIIALMAAVAAPTMMPAAAQAQPRHELRHDRQEIRREQRDVEHARRYGTREDVRRERHDVREARRDYRHDRAEHAREWRHDDWRRYREQDRNRFARGHWNAPFRYHRYTPGVRIDRGYYGARYVIHDPWRYRLPRVSARYVWVRHYDDVLLIDRRRGRVVRVMRGFFW